MNVVDVVVLLLLGLSAYSGYRRGAVLQVFSFGGLLIGLAVGAVLAPTVAGVAPDLGVQAGIALGTLFVAGGVGNAVGWMVGAKVRSATRRITALRPADAVGGALLSVTLLLLSVWFVALNLVNGPVPSVSRQIRRSVIVRGLDRALPPPPSIVSEARRFLNRFGFPEVFVGLPPAPGGPVRTPTQAQARRAFLAADQSTVRIVGEGCGAISEGSGFTVAPNHVVTNAHVVAGVSHPQVQEQLGDSQNATVVLFDPRLDIAVLRVQDTPGTVLSLAAVDAERGEKGAVLGYPEGGNLRGRKAAVRGAIEAVGRDIYGRETVARDVYELQADVRPGNSGGPFVLVDGTVAALVFAASSTDPNVGYALTADEVQPAVRKATARSGPASTGSCIR